MVQALADNRFMELTFECGTFPCMHWIGLLSSTLQEITKTKDHKRMQNSKPDMTLFMKCYHNKAKQMHTIK